MNTPRKTAPTNAGLPGRHPLNGSTIVRAARQYSVPRIGAAVLAFAALAGLASSASAQNLGYFADPLAIDFGGASANPPALNIGNTFHVTGSGITVYQLGAFDWQADGLATSHQVTLFSNQTALASVVVPAGTAAPLKGGFRLASLTSPIFLAAGTYAVVSYQMNTNDPYGDYNSENTPGFNTGASVSSGDGIFEFTTSSSSYPTNVDSGYNFVSATFTYIDSTGVWNGAGADNNWTTGGNWNIAPVFPTVVDFAGTTRLANNNDNSGITLNGLLFDPGAGAFTVSGNDITLAGNIGFGSSPAVPVTQTVNLNMAWSVNESINVPTNSSLTLNGNITSGNGLTKIGTGTLTLGGVNSIAGWLIDSGTNIITGNTILNGTGGSVFYVGSRRAAYKGTLVIQPGATLSVTGNFGDAAVLGRDGGSGTVIQNGGTFSFNPANNQLFLVGASGSAATHAEYDMHGGLFDLNNFKLGIGLGNGALINCVLNQTGGVITNVGDLDLGTLTANGHGEFDLTGGTIYIGSGGISTFNSLYSVNLGGGTIAAGVNWSSPLNMTLTGSNGPVTFDTSANTITLAGTLSGAGGLTKIGSGTLEFSVANNYTGPTLINAGTLQFDVAGTSSSAINIANGATLNLNYSGARVLPGLSTNDVALPIGTYDSSSLPGYIIGSGSIQVASSISTGLWTGNGADNNWSTANNWDQNAVPVFPIGLTFAGTSKLVNNNDLSGIIINSFTFDAAAGAFTLGGNDATLAGNIGFNGNPVTPVTQTINLNLNVSADTTIDTPTNGSVTLGGSINASANTLTKADAGSLTLAGSDNFAGLIVNNGTNILTGTTTINGTGGTLFYLGNNGPAYNGTLVIQPGASVAVTGSFGDAAVIGRNGGSGRLIQNGGTFTFSPANQTYIFVGATSQAETQAEYDMNGGMLDMSGYTLGLGLGDNSTAVTGVLNQTGGTIANLFKLDLGAVRSFGTGVYNLSGGIIMVDFGGIVSDDGLYAMNLGGGTIQALSSWTCALNMNLTNVNGSVTFDPNGNAITLTGTLSGNGGLIVGGSGVVELSGTNSYTGTTVVNAGGTLQLDTPGTSQGPVTLANGALLNLNFSGTVVVPGFLTNGVALPIGTYNSGNLSGYLIGSGNLQVAGLIFASQPMNQLVYLNKGKTATFTAAVTGGSAMYQWYLNNNPIPGATSSTLTLSNLSITNGGNLYVVATGASGSVTSSVVALTIYAVNNDVFVYDGFAYAAGSVDGSSQNGGLGWNGPWQQTDGNGVIISSAGLVGGGNVPAGYDSRSVGNSIEVPSNAQTRSGRFFDTSTNSELFKQGFVDANGNVGANGKTIYLSFLQQPDRTTGFYELEFHKGNLSDPGRIGGIGNDAGANNVNLRAPNGVNNRIIGPGSTGVSLYVVRIDYKAGNDDVFVYRNPTSITEPAAATLTVSNVADMSFNGVSVAAYNGPDLKTDEIRLGATWADAIGLAVSNLLPPTKTSDGYSVQFAATPGYTYRIQRASVVTGPYVDISTQVAPENGYLMFDDTTAPAGGAFYRTVTP